GRLAVRGLRPDAAAARRAAVVWSRLAHPTVDDHHRFAGEEPVDDEPRADVRRILADGRGDLLHDLLRGDAHAEHATAGRHDVQHTVVRRQHDRPAPADAVVGAAAGDDGPGRGVFAEAELQVRKT